jgi:trimethylamine-N-oxide reductase (cytochrome c)
MLHQIQDGQRLSRRQLLATGAAVGMFGPSLLAHGARAAVPDGEVLTGSHWGAFHAKVQGGRFVAIRPWEKDPHPSAQLPGVMDSVYAPTRIKYPMVRRAFLEKGPGVDVASRGSGDFVRVSWDKALDLVASELKRVEQKYGPAATYAGSYGWMSPGRLHNCQTLLRRMMNLKGGFVNSSGDYSTGAAQIIMPHVLGTLEVYEQQTVWPVVTASTELLVIWGADPVVTNQIQLWRRRSWRVRRAGGVQGDGQEGALHRSDKDRDVRIHGRRVDRTTAADRCGADAGHRTHAVYREAAQREVPEGLHGRLRQVPAVSARSG